MNRTEKYRADGQAAINSLREFLYYVISNPGEFNARVDLVKALGSQGGMVSLNDQIDTEKGSI